MEGKNNNIIKLPFKIPKYKTYSINTAINGILEAYGNDEVWLYNNYISLWIYAKRERKEYMVDFKYDRDVNYYEQCPMLETVILNVRKNQNVNNIIKNSIDNKEYIFLAVDMYFIDSWWKDIEKKNIVNMKCLFGDMIMKKKCSLQQIFSNILIQYKRFHI